MPFPVAAAIGAGATLLGSGANMVSQGKTNKKSREFTREMYAQQLSDNKNNWDLQNAYNHPAQQMERLREAGLNPNLVCGDGTVANSSNPPSNADVKMSYATPPRLDTGFASNLVDDMVKTQRLELDKKLVAADIELKKNQSIKVLTDAEATSIDNQTRNDINSKRSTLLNYQAENQFEQANLNYTKNEIEKMMAEPNKRKVEADIALKTAQRMAIPMTLKNIESMIESRKYQIEKQKFLNELERAGIPQNGNGYFRSLGIWMKKQIDDYNNSVEEEFQPQPMLK